MLLIVMPLLEGWQTICSGSGVWVASSVWSPQCLMARFYCPWSRYIFHTCLASLTTEYL